MESGNDSETSQSDYLQECLKNDSDSRQNGVRREVGNLKTRSKKTGEFVVPTKRGQAIPGRDAVREQVPGFKLLSKKPVDKHAAAAKAGGGMQPPAAATKAGVGFQPPSANVHFLPSPITWCCYGICTQDACIGFRTFL